MRSILESGEALHPDHGHNLTLKDAGLTADRNLNDIGFAPGALGIPIGGLMFIRTLQKRTRNRCAGFSARLENTRQRCGTLGFTLAE